MRLLAAGRAKKILVISAEALSRFSDWTDRSTCVLFGDAAGAAAGTAVDRGAGIRGAGIDYDELAGAIVRANKRSGLGNAAFSVDGKVLGSTIEPRVSAASQRRYATSWRTRQARVAAAG